MHDVAAAAGVSTSTASRAMSGRGYVSPVARARVEGAADRLGYVPNGIAQGLRARTTRVIGVLISDLTNSFYAEVASGIEGALRDRGYRMLLADSDGRREDEEDALRTFHSMRTAGLIIAPSAPASHAIERLLRSGMPVVEVDRVTTDGSCDAVVVENAAGAYEATRHLVQLGHRRIGLVAGEVEFTTGAGRLDGYRRALLDGGVPVDEAIIRYTSFHPNDAREVAAELLEAHPDITALFATNNVLAQGALRAIRDRGWRVPRDVSLVAFDDSPWMEFAAPGVSTVAQPAEEMGRVAVSLLLDRLSRELTGPPVTRSLTTRLIHRASAGPPRRKP